MFDEPPKIESEAYHRVVARVVEAIRDRERDRLIICDGREWGNEAPAELVRLGVAGGLGKINSLPFISIP